MKKQTPLTEQRVEKKNMEFLPLESRDIGKNMEKVKIQ